MKGYTGIPVVGFLNGMRHCRNHGGGQTHTIEFHHATLFHKGIQFKDFRFARWRFEHTDGQHALSIGFIQGRRVDLDRFTAFAGKNSVVYRGWIAPRGIEDEIGVEAWFLVPLPVDVVRLPDNGFCFDTDAVVPANGCLVAIKAVIKGCVRTPENRSGAFFKVSRWIFFLFKIIQMHELHGIGNQVAFRTLVGKRNLCAYGSRFFFIEAKSTKRKPQVVNGRFDGLIDDELGFALCMTHRVGGCLRQTLTPAKANPHFV